MSDKQHKATQNSPTSSPVPTPPPPPSSPVPAPAPSGPHWAALISQILPNIMLIIQQILHAFTPQQQELRNRAQANMPADVRAMAADVKIPGEPSRPDPGSFSDILAHPFANTRELFSDLFSDIGDMFKDAGDYLASFSKYRDEEYSVLLKLREKRAQLSQGSAERAKLEQSIAAQKQVVANADASIARLRKEMSVSSGVKIAPQSPPAPRSSSSPIFPMPPAAPSVVSAPSSVSVDPPTLLRKGKEPLVEEDDSRGTVFPDKEEGEIVVGPAITHSAELSKRLQELELASVAAVVDSPRASATTPVPDSEAGAEEEFGDFEGAPLVKATTSPVPPGL